MTLRKIHTSGHGSVDGDVLRAQALRWIEEHHPHRITHTETGRDNRSRALAGIEGYGLAHVNGPDGQDECALQYRLDGPHPVRVRAVLLSELPIPRRGGKFCYALHTEFDDGSHELDVHMPSGVQGNGRINDTEQGDVYRSAIGGLRRYVAGLDGRVAITGDWNLDEELPWVREYFKTQFPAFTLPRIPETGGTHGRRWIDFTIARGYTTTAVELPTPAALSDHDAVLETLKEIIVATPKTDALIAALRRRGVEVLTHDQWDSQHRDVYRQRLTTRPHELLPSKPVDTLWNHITVTFGDGVLIGEFKADCREVERIGFQRFGSGVSYNILVDHNATKPRVAIGQFLEAKGTHTVNDKKTPGFSRDQNAVALALAWVGVPGDRLNTNAREAIVQVNAALIEVDAMTAHYDNVPHSLVAAKECPTDELRDMLPGIKRDALAVVNPTEGEFDMSPEELRAIVREEIARNQLKIPNADGDLVPLNDDTVARRILAGLERIETALKGKG